MPPSKKILLVDDSSTVLMLQRMMLSENGYVLVSARNGREALEVARKERPDLIFMDVVMPEMSGYEACRALRAQEATSKTPIIMVTTRGAPLSVQEGYASGCTDYITKPFERSELMAKLERYLSAA